MLSCQFISPLFRPTLTHWDHPAQYPAYNCGGGSTHTAYGSHNSPPGSGVCLSQPYLQPPPWLPVAQRSREQEEDLVRLATALSLSGAAAKPQQTTQQSPRRWRSDPQPEPNPRVQACHQRADTMSGVIVSHNRRLFPPATADCMQKKASPSGMMR